MVRLAGRVVHIVLLGAAKPFWTLTGSNGRPECNNYIKSAYIAHLEEGDVYELAVRGALIEDGSGQQPVEADFAVDGGRIAAIGTVGAARAEINADGLVAAPGFVDAHTHDDMELHSHPDNAPKLRQGVTTVICGSCGFSAFPHVPGQRSPDFLSVDGCWRTYREYQQVVAGHGIGTNFAAFVGHNTVQSLLLGIDSTEPSAQTLSLVRDDIRRAMDDGALGVSTGLIYRPGRHTSTAALTLIVGAVADYGGLHSTHMRDESDGLLEAIAEVASISQETGVALQISHLKVIGEQNWGSLGTALDQIDRFRAEGIDIGFDVYPYTAGSGPLATYFPPDDIDVARARLVQIIRCVEYPHFEGRRLPDIAREEGTSLRDLTRRLVTAPNAGETLCNIFEIHEDDMLEALSHPAAMVGSDGIPQQAGVPHPRLQGTFPRVLGYYTRDMAVLSQSAAIKKMTSVPAARYGLRDRGLLRPGFAADVVVFDPATIADCGTYTSRADPNGIRHVLVNGQQALLDGELTGVRAGQILRRDS
ncbi:MAG: D-aminoacylase [Acidimicrobiia bacterium]|nr:D-aminoacylase [Acidimicrobiia bacterium]MYE72499.1 D-aminoacylase [Acidimicrobiia bacterium]MYJ62776.1 D-aminoacylase [Acidimicrobiia bacterium]